MEAINEVTTSKLTMKRKSSCAGEEFFIRYYSPDDLKILLFLCLANMFEEQKNKKLGLYQKEADDDLMRTGIHFNRNSSTITIKPLKREIVDLKDTSAVLKAIVKLIEKKLMPTRNAVTDRKPGKKLTSSAFNETIAEGITPIIDQSPKATPTVDMKSANASFLGTSVNFKNFSISKLKLNRSKNNDKEKENEGGSTRLQSKAHRKAISNLSEAVFSEKIDSTRRQRFFMLRKKQQLSFLNKIAVTFSSGEAEFKALVQIMQIFLKNLSRTNYFLKIIEQSITQHHKIMVYIQQLLKVLGKILGIFKQLASLHKMLQLKEEEEEEPIQKIETMLEPMVQEYYEKSHQIIKIIRHFSLSVVFSSLMIPCKGKCTKLINLFAQARYVLRYMEKDIQNLEPRKKQGKSLPKWQKAFRSKFLPKNTFY